jgi:hypothetical protein
VQDAGDQRLVWYALLLGALLQPGQVVLPDTDVDIPCLSRSRSPDFRLSGLTGRNFALSDSEKDRFKKKETRRRRDAGLRQRAL